MPGLDGFGVLRALAPDPLPLVVFVTAYDGHAVRAFEVHAVDYLIKPFSHRRFADTLDRARRQLHHAAAADAARRLSALLSAPLTETPTEPRVEPRADTLIATTGRRSVVLWTNPVDEDLDSVAVRVSLVAMPEVPGRLLRRAGRAR
jgi:two-component system LytT family response regulator